MAKPSIALIETNVEAVIESYDKCDAGNCDGCAFESIHRDWPPACAFYQRESGRYLLKKLVPRLMTLEEVQQMGKRNMEHNDLPYETCICEVKTRRGLHICSPFWNEPLFEGDESHLEIQFEYMGTDEYDNVPVKKYEWYIRCWTSTPSKEQMEATPWL